MENYSKKILSYSISILTTVAIAGALVYRAYSLNNFGVLLSILIATLSVFIILFLAKKSNQTNVSAKTDKIKITSQNKINFMVNLAMALLYLCSICVLFYLLFKNQTVASIISPWEVVPTKFFIIYFISLVLLLLNIIRNNRLALLLIVVHCFFSFLIALIIFKIGFGFDNFIHEATLKLIDQNGLVTPKPFYYLSFYSLIIIAHKIFFLPLPLLNKFLIPFLAAIFLPFAFSSSLSTIFNNRQKVILTIFFLLILPFSIFTLSTPQNFAFLLLLLEILIALNIKTKKDWVLIFLLALSALLAQPIAGIPALIFACLIYFNSHLPRFWKQKIIIIFYILTAISLPASFILLEKNNEFAGKIENQLSVNNVVSQPTIIIPGQENFILNFIYLYAFNLKFIIFLLAVPGIWLAWRERQKYQKLFFCLGMSIALILAYYFSSLLSFNFIIAYEKSDFLNRILITAVLFLLPFIFLSLYSFLIKLEQQKKIVQWSVYLFFLLLISVSLYISYPRFDRYYNSHSYTASQADIDAVRWIANDAKGQDYIVLANQQVSAAALSQLGFKKYYHDNIFYYPIPTSSPLYQYYLDMVYQAPNKKTALAALDLVGAQEVYFVLNKYWWAFPKILAEAEFNADSWQEFGPGEVYVFKYKK